MCAVTGTPQKKSIPRQRLARRVSAATDSLVKTKELLRNSRVPAATNKHENNRGTVGNGDMYSVLPGVINGGHVIGDSVGREFRRQFSSSVEMSVQLWSLNERTTEAGKVINS
jgi:hypothetical protein